MITPLVLSTYPVELGIHIGYLWLIAALFFLLAELTTPGLFFFVAFSIGSCGASLAAFIGFSLVIQCIVGLVVMLLSFMLIRHCFSAKPKKTSIQTNTEALIGQKGMVLQKITSEHLGQIKVGGESWPALGQDDISLSQGTIVTIVDVVGNKLIVKK